MRVQINLRPLIQLVTSIYLAIVSLAIAVIVTNNLTYSDRQNYGIFMVSLGQLFVFIQFGAPGAFNLVGLSPLKISSRVEILLFFSKRFVSLCFLTILIVIAFNLPIVVSLIVIGGYVALIPMQWLTNGIQKHVSSITYSIWRVLPISLQFLLVFSFKISNENFTLLLFVTIWSVSNILTLGPLILKYFNTKIPKSELIESEDLVQVSKIGKAGLVAHIGLSDLVRLENFLIPFFLPVFYSANYFAVGGLANWPRTIIDGLSIAYFHGYKIQDLTSARKSAAHRLLLVIVFALSALVMVMPVGDQILQKILGPQYSTVFNLFLALSASTLLSSGRRMYLDSFRAHGESKSAFASKLELRSWIISLLSLPLLFFSDSINLWAWSSAVSNLLALIFLIRMGNKCEE